MTEKREKHRGRFIIPQRLFDGGILYAKSVNEVIVVDVERMEEIGKETGGHEQKKERRWCKMEGEEE